MAIFEANSRTYTVGPLLARDWTDLIGEVRDAFVRQHLAVLPGLPEADRADFIRQAVRDALLIGLKSPEFVASFSMPGAEHRLLWAAMRRHQPITFDEVQALVADPAVEAAAMAAYRLANPIATTARAQESPENPP